VVREVRNYGRLGRSKIFSGQVSRQTLEVRHLKKFVKLGRSKNLGGREVGSTVREEGSAGSPHRYGMYFTYFM
jgi:hypothetical protein